MKSGKYSIQSSVISSSHVCYGYNIVRKRMDSPLLFYHSPRTHPYFISIEAYAELIAATGVMNVASTADWVKETIASWRHSVWVGIYDPRGFVFKPHKYLKCVRDAYCLERMHRAFDRGLMQYGMFAATKKE
jgi:MPBQ/MSBQ methyltransferase